MAKRALMLGLDGLVPNTAERFLADGLLPNMASLIERGCFTRLRPVIPAQTPTNWTTMATGATPGTHGIVQWGTHPPNGPAWEMHRAEAFSSGICQADYIWEAAERAGLRSVVMNYAGYPPTTGAATHIDWLFSPTRSFFDIATPTVYHNCPDIDTTDPIELRQADGFTNVPPSNMPPLEATIEVAPATDGSGPGYKLLVIARATGYDTVLIVDGTDASNAVAEVSVGAWSEWVTAPFETEDQGAVDGAFRFKLVELSPDGSRTRLYRSDAFRADGGFCSDPDLAAELIADLGPYVHSGMSLALHRDGAIDWETIDEIMADETVWWSSAAEAAMEKTDASLFYLHWHNLDMIGHAYVQYVDPTGTDYDVERADEYMGIIAAYYGAADRFVGAFMEKFDDGETAIAVASDHGMPANKTGVSLVNAFKGRGWLALTEDGDNVDWAKSKLFFAQNHLWISLAGRDEGGVVPPDEYESLRAEVIATMRDIKDPKTGEHAFPFVLTREDAPMVGLWGDHIGDVVYCYSGGFRWSGPEVLAMGETRVVFPNGGGNHGPMMPTYETDTTSVMGTLMLAGSGVKAGVRLPKGEQVKVCTTDVAPTLARLLGIEPPAQSEGRALQEFLSGAASERPRREYADMSRPIRNRRSTKPGRRSLQGDVTDET